MDFFIKRRIKNPKKIGFWGMAFVKLLGSVRVTVLLSSINDLILYSSHEILHHDRQIEQSSTANLSYFFSIIIFNFCILDLVRVFIQLKNFEPVQFIILNKIILELKRKAKLLQYKSKQEKIEMEAKGLEIEKKKLTEIKKFSSFCHSKIILSTGMTTMMMIEDLKLPYLNPKLSVFYIRYTQILRTVAFELLIASLQPLPKLQISLILLVQTLMLFNTLYCVFYKNCFESFFWSIVFVFDELSIWAFLLLISQLEFLGRESFKVELWMRIQILCICLIVLSTVLNLVVMVFNTILNALIVFFSCSFRKGSFGEKKSRNEIFEISEILQKNFKIKIEKIECIKKKIREEFGEGEKNNAEIENKKEVKIEKDVPVEPKIEDKNTRQPRIFDARLRSKGNFLTDKPIPVVPYSSKRRGNKKKSMFKEGFQELWDKFAD